MIGRTGYRLYFLRVRGGDIIVRVVSVALLAVLSSIYLPSLTTAGTIVGTVSDPTGQVIPGATARYSRKVCRNYFIQRLGIESRYGDFAPS